MRKTIIGAIVAVALAIAGGAQADEARESQGCIYSEKFVRWVCPTPSNNYLRDPFYVEVQAGGDGAGAGASSGGDSGGATSGGGPGGNGGGNGCGTR